MTHKLNEVSRAGRVRANAAYGSAASRMILMIAMVGAGFALHAQDTSIWIRGKEMKPGTSKAEVLNELGENSDVKRYPGDGERWCVKEKNDHRSPPWDCPDTLQFQGDKLAAVSHRIGSAANDDAADVVSRLFSVVSRARASGTEVVLRAQDELEVERIRIRALTVTMGDKILDLTSYEPIGSGVGRVSYITLTETLVRNRLVPNALPSR